MSCIHFTFALLPPADGRNGFHQCARRAISDSSCSFQKSTRCKHDGGSAHQNHRRYCGLPLWERRAVLLLPCADSSQLDLNLRCPLAHTRFNYTHKIDSRLLKEKRWLKVMRFHDGSSCCSIILQWLRCHVIEIQRERQNNGRGVRTDWESLGAMMREGVDRKGRKQGRKGGKTGGRVLP